MRRKLNFDLDKGDLPLNSATRQKLREITEIVEASEGQLENDLSKISDDLPQKSTLEKPLQPAEIKQNIDKWDLNNPSPNDKILVSKVQGDELEQLKKEFDFKGNYALAREIEAKNVKHALMQHGDETKEATRGQIAITKDDIADYQQFTQKPDLRIVQDNNRIIYAKQVNGYYVVIEEVLTGQNKLQFFDMWKGKGKINKEVLLSHSQRPKHDFEPNSNRHMPSNTDEIIPNSAPQSQATPKAPAQTAQEAQTKSKFELDEWNGKVDETNHTEFIDDAVETIQRRELFETPIFDPTKNAVKTKSEALQRLDELESANAYPKEAIESVRQKLVSDDENLSQSIRTHKEQRLAENAQIEAQKAEITAQQKAEYPNGVYHYETPNESVSIRLSDDGAEVITHNKDFDSKGTMTTQREHAVNLIKVGENTKNASWTQRPQKAQSQAEPKATKATKTPEQMQGEFDEIKKLSENPLETLENDELRLQLEIHRLRQRLIKPFDDAKLLNPNLRSDTDEKMFRQYVRAKETNDAQIEAKQKELEKIQKALYRKKYRLGKENLTADIVRQAEKENKRIFVDDFDNPQAAQQLGFKNPYSVERSLDADEIRHTLNAHGENSQNAKNGQPPVNESDIANYPQIADSADEVIFSKSEQNLPVKVSFKQVNGYFVVVEEVHNGRGELAFKTMYKGNGNFKNSNAYKNAGTPPQAPVLPTAKSGGFSLSGDEIIPNSAPQSQGKIFGENPKSREDWEVFKEFFYQKYPERKKELQKLFDKQEKDFQKLVKTQNNLTGADLIRESEFYAIDLLKNSKTFNYSLYGQGFISNNAEPAARAEFDEFLQKNGYETKALKNADESAGGAKNAEIQGENQILAENVVNFIKNANKEQLEYELKNIEKYNAYNKQVLDYYKQRLPESPYFQGVIDFVENLLLKDTEKQRLITQRLDELKRGENLDKAFEFSTPKEPKSAFAMRKEVREVLEPVFDKPLTNANDGRVAVISKKKSSKLSSSKAAEKSVENGFSEAQHFETAKHLPELYENAIFRDTMPDKNGDPNLSIHHYTADFMLDGEPAQAKITLKETIDGNFKGNRIYTIELEEVAPKIQQHGGAMGEQNAMSRKPAAVPTDTPTANPKEIIPKTKDKSQIEMTARDINRKNKLENENKILEKQIQELQKEYEKHLPKLEQLEQIENEAFQKWRLLWDEPKKENPSPEALKAYEKLEKECDKAQRARADFQFNFLGQQRGKINNAKSQISKNQQSLEKLAKKYEILQMQSDISAKELLEHNVIDADFVRARDSVSVNENIIQKAERENFKLPDNIFQYENGELEIQPNIAKRYLGAHAHNQNELEKAMSYLVNKYIERFIQYRGGGLKSVGKEKALERLRFLDDLQREIQYEKEALSGGENAKKQVSKGDESAENLGKNLENTTPRKESAKHQQILDEYLAKNEKLAQGMKEIVGKDDISVDDFIDILNGSNAELKFTKEDLLDYDKLVKTAPYTTPELANILGLYKKELEKGIDAVNENLRQMFNNGTLKENNKGQYLFTDKGGKKHILDKNLAHKWLQTFELKSFDDDFVPQIKDEFKAFLQNGEIHLKIGSLIKINNRNRADFIAKIKPTLQEPNAILRQNDGALIFVKDFKDKKFFASVAKDENGEWVITSNAPKTLANLKNKIKNGGELLYSDLPELPIIAQPELTAKALSGEANPKEIIPKTTNKSQIDERTNPNILMANQHAGAGLLGGTINGLETDENGNVIGFSPEKFVAGFLGGAGASKATQFALKNPKIRAKADKFLKESGEFIVRELRDENLSAQARQGLERLFGKALVRAMDSRAFIIAGENAIGANKAKLARAKTLQKAGKSDDEIWLKTGWYEDKDGKWKFEINPQGGELHLQKEYMNDPTLMLIDILKDDELFKAYPNLAHLKIELKEFGDSWAIAGYADESKKIALNVSRLKDKENAKSALYHEIQHAVQDIEGFAKGTSSDNVNYTKYHGEVEARNIQNRMNGGYNFQTNEKEFVKKRNELLERDKKANEKRNELLNKKFANEAYDEKELDKVYKELDEIRVEWDTLHDTGKKYAFKEVDTKAHPHKTQDINVKDSIVSFDDDMMMSEDLANSGEKIRKNDIITGNFFIKGKNQMAQKPQEPRFEVTKTLEKTYRNAQIIPKESVKTTLNLNGRVVGDFIKIAQKHPEYFANPKEAQELCQSVLSHAKIGIKASNEGIQLIIAPVKDKRGDFGGVALRIQNINREHRIRSVLFMDTAQVEVKLKRAKELGEPILQF